MQLTSLITNLNNNESKLPKNLMVILRSQLLEITAYGASKTFQLLHIKQCQNPN